MTEDRLKEIELESKGFGKLVIADDVRELIAEVRRLQAQYLNLEDRYRPLNQDKLDAQREKHNYRQKNEFLRALLFEAKKTCVTDCKCGSSLAKRIDLALEATK